MSNFFRFTLRRPLLALALPTALALSACSGQETASAAVEAAPAEIGRYNEGRNFYGVISIPPGAETLYLSGAGAQPRADGSWGSMEEQAIDIFTTYKATLESMGWSLEDVVQVRVFAVAGEDGVLDFAGFNTGYQQFFGSDINPMKPVRSFVQVAALVREGWLAEVEIRAARVPK
ncbi:MAG: Rid family hydrolase [Gammaproteobacteria bacterium]